MSTEERDLPAGENRREPCRRGPAYRLGQTGPLPRESSGRDPHHAVDEEVGVGICLEAGQVAERWCASSASSAASRTSSSSSSTSGSVLRELERSDDERHGGKRKASARARTSAQTRDKARSARKTGAGAPARPEISPAELHIALSGYVPMAPTLARARTRVTRERTRARARFLPFFRRLPEKNLVDFP